MGLKYDLTGGRRGSSALKCPWPVESWSSGSEEREMELDQLVGETPEVPLDRQSPLLSM